MQTGDSLFKTEALRPNAPEALLSKVKGDREIQDPYM